MNAREGGAKHPAWSDKHAEAFTAPPRSVLFVPASSAAMLSTAWVYGADLYTFDLEDAVAAREKDAARLLAVHALASPAWRDVGVAVRVNGMDTPHFAEDLTAVVSAGAAQVRLPMTQDAAMVAELDVLIGRIERVCGREPGSTRIMAAIESAAGVVNAVEIARASPRLSALALAGFDYLLDIGAARTREGAELRYARSVVLHAARAAGIACYDVVWGDVEDEAGFRNEAELARSLGFDGKSLINPRQVPLLHQVYSPSSEELRRANRIVAAAQDAEAHGRGVVLVDGEMVDGPVMAAARRTLAYTDSAPGGFDPD